MHKKGPASSLRIVGIDGLRHNSQQPNLTRTAEQRKCVVLQISDYKRESAGTPAERLLEQSASQVTRQFIEGDGDYRAIARRYGVKVSAVTRTIARNLQTSKEAA